MQCNTKKVSPFNIWLMWTSVLLFFIYQFIPRSSFSSVLNEQFMDYFSLDNAGVGGLISCYYIAYTIAQIPVGIIIDKCSLRTVATIASALCAAGVSLFVLTQNCYFASIGQLLTGFCSAFAFILLLKIIATWFPVSKRAMITSITISVGSISPVVFGPAVASLANQFYWKDIMLIFSGIGIFISAFIWFAVMELPQEERTTKSTGGDLKQMLKKIATSKEAWILALFTMCLYSPLSAVGDMWGVAFLKKAYSIDAATASFGNNMLYIGLIISGPIFAALVSSLNSYRKPMLIAIVIGIAAFSAIVFCDLTLNAMFAMLFSTGIACGGMLTFAMSSLIFPANMSATVSSFINMASMVSGVILQPLVGKLIQLSWDGTIENGVKIYSTGDYKCSFFSVLVFLVFGLLFGIMMKDKHPNEK